MLPHSCREYARKQACPLRYVSSLRRGTKDRPGQHRASIVSFLLGTPTLARGTGAPQNSHCVTGDNRPPSRAQTTGPPSNQQACLKTRARVHVQTAAGWGFSLSRAAFTFSDALEGIGGVRRRHSAPAYCYQGKRKGAQRWTRGSKSGQLRLSLVRSFTLVLQRFPPPPKEKLIQILKHFLVSGAFSHFIIQRKMEQHPYNGLNDIKNFTLKVYTLLLLLF